MKTFLLIMAILVLCSCAPMRKAADTCGYIQNIDGERIQWRTNAIIPLYIHDSVPMEYRQAITSAIRDYETSVGKSLFSVQGTDYGPLKPRQDGLNVIYWVQDWTEANDISAVTRIYSHGDTIIETDIRINASKSYYVDTPKVYNDFHLESIIAHELGHILGLAHNNDPLSIMYEVLPAQTKKTLLTLNDVKAVRCGY